MTTHPTHHRFGHVFGRSAAVTAELLEAPSVPGRAGTPPIRTMHRASRLQGEVRSVGREQGAPMTSLVYTPAGGTASPARATLVCVHGVTRRMSEQFAEWAPWAEALGLTLVTPLFSADEFPGYQRLGGLGRERRSDEALLRLLRQLRAEGLVSTGPLILFGYSGGAQFVHRFLMAHPGAATAVAVAAAGFYTFPDPLTPFPYGLAGRQPALETHLDGFLKKPILVAVGEADVHRDRQLRKRLWLDAWQGETRVDRAVRWTAALRRAASRREISSRVEFLTLPGAGHSFTDCMAAGLGRETASFINGVLDRASTLAH
jgi:pimeloyl-ACP methyl ester carboxylesterase